MGYLGILIVVVFEVFLGITFVSIYPKRIMPVSIQVVFGFWWHILTTQIAIIVTTIIIGSPRSVVMSVMLVSMECNLIGEGNQSGIRHHWTSVSNHGIRIPRLV